MSMKVKKIRRWLTNEEKAEIVLKRDTRQVTGQTNKDIADEMGISEYTVQHMTRDNIPFEAREIYEEKKAKLSDLALDVTTAALLKSKELIGMAESARDLSGLAAVGKFSDGVHRLETRQPTEIRSWSAQDHAMAFFNLLLEKTGSREVALDGLRRADLEPLVSDSQRMEAFRRISIGDD